MDDFLRNPTPEEREAFDQWLANLSMVEKDNMLHILGMYLQDEAKKRLIRRMPEDDMIALHEATKATSYINEIDLKAARKQETFKTILTLLERSKIENKVAPEFSRNLSGEQRTDG